MYCSVTFPTKVMEYRGHWSVTYFWLGNVLIRFLHLTILTVVMTNGLQYSTHLSPSITYFWEKLITKCYVCTLELTKRRLQSYAN